jgi:hypothetical protein
MDVCTAILTYSGGNVKDGKGEAVKKHNKHYLELIAKVTQTYRNSNQHVTKRSIALQVYHLIKTSGNNLFLDKDGREKSEVEAVNKIMKSLKDYNKRKRHLTRTPTLRDVGTTSTNVTTPQGTVLCNQAVAKGGIKRKCIVPPKPAVVVTASAQFTPSVTLKQPDAISWKDSVTFVRQENNNLYSVPRQEVDNNQLSFKKVRVSSNDWNRNGFSDAGIDDFDFNIVDIPENVNDINNIMEDLDHIVDDNAMTPLFQSIANELPDEKDDDFLEMLAGILDG